MVGNTQNKWIVPLTKPFVTREMWRTIAEKLEDETELTAGKYTTEFEELVKAYTGAKYAIACSSATVGLTTAWKYVYRQGYGTTLISAYTHPATVLAAENAGFDVFFGDVYLDSLHLKDSCILDHGVIGTVSLFGAPFEYSEYEYKRKIVIEDAACSVGSSMKGYMTGNNPNVLITVFSFHPRKIITTGEGGMILTNDEEAYKWMRRYTTFGFNEETGTFDQGGSNFKMSNINALLGIEQMKAIDYIIEERYKIANWYYDMLPSNTLYQVHDGKRVFQSFIILDREGMRIRKELREQGIEVQIGSYNCTNLPRWNRFILPNAQRAYEEAISLPIFPEMTKDQVEIVVKKLREVG